MQVAKKSLIAAQFAQDSSKASIDGNLQDVARELDDENMKSMASGLAKVLGDPNRMHYPTQHQYPSIPHEFYTEETAHRALSQTREIFETADKKINGIL